MMENNPLIDVLDGDGIRTGETCSRKEIHEQGKWHRAVHLYLFNRSNQLLLQRRSSHVDHYPGMLSISLTGHVAAGESSSDALNRELFEELGLDSKNMKPVFLFSYKQSKKISFDYIDRQFNDIYTCRHELNIEDISFDPSAITELQFISLSEFASMLADETDFAKIYSKEAEDVMHFMQAKI